jgi:hypothetical protein
LSWVAHRWVTCRSPNWRSVQPVRAARRAAAGGEVLAGHDEQPLPVLVRGGPHRARPVLGGDVHALRGLRLVHRGGDHEFPARGEAGEQQRAVEDRVVGGDHHVTGGDANPLVGGQHAGLALGETDHAGALVQPAAAPAYVVRQRHQVLAGVELGLLSDPHGARHGERQVRLGHEFGRQPRLPRGLRLGPHLGDAVAALHVGVRGRLLPVAVDPQLPGDLGGVADRVHLGAGVQPRAFLAAAAAQPVVDQGVLGADLGRGVPGDTGRDPAGLQHRDVVPLPDQLPRRAQPGYARADHSHVDGDIPLRRGGRIAGRQCLEPVRPEGLRLFAHARRVPTRRAITRRRPGAGG